MGRLPGPFVHDDSFIGLSLRNADSSSIVTFISSGMTAEKPLDDEMFMNSNFSEMWPIRNSGVNDPYDQSSFFRIAAIRGRCPAEYGADPTATTVIVRPEGLGSPESEGAGPGVWRRRSRRRQSLTGTPPHRWGGESAIEQPRCRFQRETLHECINIKSCGCCWWRMKSKFKASCSVR